jgi:hypothetical protein
VPALAAGLAAPHVGLFAAFRVFALLVAVVALGAAALAWRIAPEAPASDDPRRGCAVGDVAVEARA